MAERVRNIGPQGQRTRLISGLVGLGIGIAIAAVLLFTGVSRWWRLVLFLPFWQGGLGIFQALNKTWVYLAARGLRDINGEEEKIEDPDELAQVRRQATQVHVEAVLFGILLTAVALALPV